MEERKEKLVAQLKAYRKLFPYATAVEKSMLLTAMRGIMEEIEKVSRASKSILSLFVTKS